MGSAGGRVLQPTSLYFSVLSFSSFSPRNFVREGRRRESVTFPIQAENGGTIGHFTQSRWGHLERDKKAGRRSPRQTLERRQSQCALRWHIGRWNAIRF